MALEATWATLLLHNTAWLRAGGEVLSEAILVV
jgi:hypothetical protein